MSEQYGGPVVSIESDLSVRLPSCAKCEDLRRIFKEKIYALESVFKKMADKTIEARKASYSFHDTFVEMMETLQIHSKTCTSIASDGDLPDPKPLPKIEKIHDSSVWSQLDYNEKTNSISKGLLEESLKKGLDAVLEASIKADIGDLNFKLEFQQEFPKTIKSTDVPCPACLNVKSIFCSFCGGTGMVSQKKAKTTPKITFVGCKWCGKSTKVISGTLNICNSCGKSLT